MHREFATYVLLPALLIQTGISDQDKELRKIKPLPFIDSLTPIAAAFLSKGRDLASYLKFSESWHQQHHAFPSDRLRPLANKDATWHPFTQNREYVVPFNKPGAGWRIRILTTATELKEEGKALQHCVGGSDYTNRCLTGKCHIISVCDPQGQRFSTAELDADFDVEQHKAKANRIPLRHEPAEQALNWFVEAVHHKNIMLSGERGETAASKLKRRGPAILQTIGFAPTWGNVDKALQHYQTMVAVKQNVPDTTSQQSSYPGGGWRKSIMPKSSPTAHFKMEPLVSGHAFIPDISEAAANSPYPIGETKFLSALGAEELIAASDLKKALQEIAEKHTLSDTNFSAHRYVQRHSQPMYQGR